MSQEFLQAIRTVRRKRINLMDLRRYWLQVNPEQLQHPERDTLMMAALKRLAEHEYLVLPASGSFEKIGNPPMPKFVTLVNQEEAKPRNNWSNISWLPELGFWTDLTESELITANVINDWLQRRRGKFLKVPLRERSLEIFGDEKYLDSRARNNALFSGRLTLSSIGAFQVPHPLPYRAANAPGQPVLIVENHHTYWSLAEWNVQTRRYAAIVYGAGKAFCASGYALQEVVRECYANGALYFGDLDPAGILIPISFNDANGPVVFPDIGLYQFVLEIGKRRSSVNRIIGDETAVQRWLPELSDQILALWASDHWIPQESLGTEQLFTNWEYDLSEAVPSFPVA